MRTRGLRRLVAAVVAVCACAALSAPAGAAAATVVNGDLETGTLKGWDVYRSAESGNWFAYKGKTDPVAKERKRFPPPEPPQGIYAAIADELIANAMILSQEVALEPGTTHFLALLAYYRSLAPFAVPDTLSVDDEVLAGRANQQFRIDVMRPGTPIDSVAPSDILATVFQTRPGAPDVMLPAQLTTDLSAFAGQTVRLRMAVAAHEELLTAGVDAVSISPRPPLPGSLRSRFRLGKATANRKNGTVTLSVEVPDAGLLTARGVAGRAPKAGADASKAKKALKPMKPARLTARAAGTVKLRLKPTAAGRAILRQKGKLRATVKVIFKAPGAPAATEAKAVVFKLAAWPARR